MRTLSMRALREYWEAGHTDSERPLREWFRIAEHTSWRKFADIKAALPSADQVGEKVIFNIKGNDYRLIAYVNYEAHLVLVKWVGKHSEYAKLTRKDIDKL